jgi:alpha-1,2-mannosyltransferase
VILPLLADGMKHHFYQGQLNLILLLLIMACWTMERSNRSVSAGILLGIAIAIKLFPGFLLLYFFVQRQWKCIAAATGSFLIVNLATAIVLGPKTYTAYVKDVVPLAREWQSAGHNNSIPGLWGKLFEPGRKGPEAQPLSVMPQLAHWGTLGSCLLIVALVGRRTAKAASGADRDHVFGLNILGMLLVTPVVWDHYFPLLLLPLTTLWMRLPTTGTARTVFQVTSLLLWMPKTFFWGICGIRLVEGGNWQWSLASPWQTLSGFSVHLIALLILFALAYGAVHCGINRQTALNDFRIRSRKDYELDAA